MFSTSVLICLLFNSVLATDNQTLRELENRLATSNNRLTGEFIYNGILRYPGSSFVTIVFPLLSALGQLALFSEKKNEQKLLDLLELDNKEQIRRIFPYIREEYFSEDLVASPKFDLKVYTDDDNKLCPAFKKSYKKTFGGETGEVDYSEPEEAAEEINDYVKSQGTGGFKDLVSSRKIEDKDGLNFIGTYELSFKFDDRFVFTSSKVVKFKTGKTVTIIPGAAGEGIIKYADVKSINAKVIEILARGGEYSYVVVLPNKVDGLKEVLKKFTDPEVFRQAIDQGKNVCAKLLVPSREVISKVDLANSLQQTSSSYKNLFVPGEADLRGVSQKCDDTYVASILHEVRLRPDSTNNSRKASPCTKYDVELEVNYPYAFYVMCAQREPNLVRSPIVGMAVQS
ncbi:serine protease inhibitor 20 isoform X1 [Bombyx mori]|uniref:Serpin domain-containing protein n=1 Tax=Bombyx mori TaxID=7091 RepID=A0A8R2R7Y9_BOMMO|nr:serine protease inhibitor 20 isoform X1 [Bombyx mori]